MHYIIQSTLATAVGLVVIMGWLGIGYLTIFIWHYGSKNVDENASFGGKMALGTIGGPVTFVLGIIVAYRSLRGRNDFQG